MAKFDICIVGQPDTLRVVGASRGVRKAVEMYWNERVCLGVSGGRGMTRVIVRHPDGPSVDRSVAWTTDDEGTFVQFDVQVASVEVAASEVK